jgi:stage II sporulation protein AA (anti-sigma F factor antagonist)
MFLEIVNKKTFYVIKIMGKFDEREDSEEITHAVMSLVEQGHKNIALNFKEISYVYSGVIKVIITLHKRLQKIGGYLCILETQKQLFDVMDVLGLTKVLMIYRSEKDFLMDIGF